MAAEDSEELPRIGLEVEYCPNCTMPPEYCEFAGKKFKRCKTILRDTHPELLEEFEGGGSAKPAAATEEPAAADDGAGDNNEIAGDDAATVEDGGEGPADSQPEDGGDDDGEDQPAAPAGENPDDDDDEEEGEGEDEGTGKRRRKKKKKKKDKELKMELPQISVTRLQRTKKKFVTCVSGLEAYDVKEKDAAKVFGKKFAASASVQDTGVHIQGDIVDEVCDCILETWEHIPPDCFTFASGKNKTRKKGGNARPASKR